MADCAVATHIDSSGSTRLADELQTNRSNLFRIALEEKIDRFEREELEAQLREGYVVMSELRTREHKEFEVQSPTQELDAAQLSRIRSSMYTFSKDTLGLTEEEAQISAQNAVEAVSGIEDDGE